MELSIQIIFKKISKTESIQLRRDIPEWLYILHGLDDMLRLHLLFRLDVSYPIFLSDIFSIFDRREHTAGVCWGSSVWGLGEADLTSSLARGSSLNLFVVCALVVFEVGVEAKLISIGALWHLLALLLSRALGSGWELSVASLMVLILDHVT